MIAQRVLLEVCVDAAEDAVVAAEAGADRIELNAALRLGGLTPSAGLVQETIRAIEQPVLPMIRPRPGGFVYSKSEQRVMLRDLDWLLAAGCSGIVIGALTSRREVDTDFLNQVVVQAGNAPVVFHRAFDFTARPLQALEQLVDSGVTRVLTSGAAPTALMGAEMLRELIKLGGDRIEILPGSGLRPQNLRNFLQTVPCRQVHASLSRTDCAQDFIELEGMALSAANAADDRLRQFVDPAQVQAMSDILDSRQAG